MSFAQGFFGTLAQDIDDKQKYVRERVEERRDELRRRGLQRQQEVNQMRRSYEIAAQGLMRMSGVNSDRILSALESDPDAVVDAYNRAQQNPNINGTVLNQFFNAYDSAPQSKTLSEAINGILPLAADVAAERNDPSAAERVTFASMLGLDLDAALENEVYGAEIVGGMTGDQILGSGPVTARGFNPNQAQLDYSIFDPDNLDPEADVAGFTDFDRVEAAARDEYREIKAAKIAQLTRRRQSILNNPETADMSEIDGIDAEIERLENIASIDAYRTEFGDDPILRQLPKVPESIRPQIRDYFLTPLEILEENTTSTETTEENNTEAGAPIEEEDNTETSVPVEEAEDDTEAAMEDEPDFNFNPEEDAFQFEGLTKAEVLREAEEALEIWDRNVEGTGRRMTIVGLDGKTRNVNRQELLDLIEFYKGNAEEGPTDAAQRRTDAQGESEAVDRPAPEEEGRTPITREELRAINENQPAHTEWGGDPVLSPEEVDERATELGWEPRTEPRREIEEITPLSLREYLDRAITTGSLDLEDNVKAGIERVIEEIDRSSQRVAPTPPPREPAPEREGPEIAFSIGEDDLEQFIGDIEQAFNEGAPNVSVLMRTPQGQVVSYTFRNREQFENEKGVLQRINQQVLSRR